MICSLLMSGCATANREKTDLYDQVTALVQQNQMLEVSVAERDQVIMELTRKLNQLADRLKAVLEEKDALEKELKSCDASS